MRRLIAVEFVILDGVVQAPGGPDEDASGGFAHGGWVVPYADPVQSAVIRRQMGLRFDLLLGRRTFEMWAPFWPAHPEVWPEVQRVTKYVASNTVTARAWGPSVVLGGDVAGRVRASARSRPGPCRRTCAARGGSVYHAAIKIAGSGRRDGRSVGGAGRRWIARRSGRADRG